MRIAVISDIHGNWHALDGRPRGHRAGAPSTRSGASETSSGTGRSRTAASRRRTRTRDLCLIGNHDLARDRTRRSDELLARRRDEREVDDRGARATRLARSSRRSSRRASGRASSSSTRARAIRSGSTSSASRPSARALELTSAPLVLVGHSHIPIALQLSNGDTLAGGLASGGSRGRARPRAAGSSTPARSASRATAIRVPPTC